MKFIVRGLSAEPFKHLFGKSDAQLLQLGVLPCIADCSPGFPDRIEMRDAEIGERMLLLNHVSMEIPSPYRATHAIYVRDGATERYEAVDVIPSVMSSRMLSLRAFDNKGMILDAELATGEQVVSSALGLLSNEMVQHIDVHNAARGCYSGRIERFED